MGQKAPMEALKKIQSSFIALIQSMTGENESVRDRLTVFSMPSTV